MASMFSVAIPHLNAAERAAVGGCTVEEALVFLRRLSLDDFGLFMISLPNRDYPGLSRLLPAMASEDVQKTWTGASGLDLYRQTSTFARQLENNFTRYIKAPLADSEILDFGCGYGRILRMMYYYSDPANIWGVDAWDKSLDLCREARLPGKFAQSERVPSALPVGNQKFDLIFAFSVFTHLAPPTARACLAALRNHIKPRGLFVATIRPIEFWPFIDRVRNTSFTSKMQSDHRRNGFAYLPHAGPEGETYGDISCEIDFLRGQGWTVVGHDRSILDPFQVSVLMQPG
ncbi:class I SAM-dependent methyltransferase [Mesorhizobium sp. M1E.F.Ca.ET.063.01.1.1]|uniref:class I SAM-dependent methyltransferase n=1 Tax=Mesorhizobium sp. M1E.F.Ca.ET.063.01.1.1 TaxID=2496750 RepID=UPI000FCB290A|nr:class I SAM-dependent methyltransferase [Mesorhizobium sp. M1E.F.Ca.ET.063.01.1.1]RUW86094.1 class I SAM-dependent methyltransferase [Mesorhizobium sp. M1E.F.Ca.ET.063.01.1.1]